jgi:hypothetical protein
MDGWMHASKGVAELFFNVKESIIFKDSYRAKSIREWTKHYMQHNELLLFSRGKHIKTSTIIVKEYVQEYLKIKIRELKQNERHPRCICEKLNTEWLKELQVTNQNSFK